MANCEHHEHQHGGGAKRLLAAFAVISAFMVVEAIGGFISGSLALLADATHMLTDALALGLAASAHIIARRPADLHNHYGYHRAQVLAAFVNGVLLMLLLTWIVYEAITRFLTPVDVDAGTMIVIAFLGLGANAVAFLLLHRESASNLNVRGAMLHVVGDLLGSVAAVIAAVVIMVFDWTRIDPILSMLVAALIARSAMRLIKETGHILLQGAPSAINITALKEGVKAAAPEIEDVHDVRIWQLTPEQASLTLHARVGDLDNAARVLARIKAYLAARYGISQSTVQIEVGDCCPDADSRASERSVRLHAVDGGRCDDDTAPAESPSTQRPAYAGQK